MALNDKQSSFVTEYLLCRDATKAARRAGYTGKYLHTNATKLLQNTTIQSEITQRLKEKHLSADEVLARLSDMAYADIRDFAKIESPTDLLKPQYRGKTHVIKKFKKVVTYTKAGDKIVTTELELHDSRQTLVDMGRYHKLFTDNIRLTDWRSELTDLLKQGKVTEQEIEVALGSDLATEFFKSSGLQLAGIRENQEVSTE